MEVPERRGSYLAIFMFGDAFVGTDQPAYEAGNQDLSEGLYVVAVVLPSTRGDLAQPPIRGCARRPTAGGNKRSEMHCWQLTRREIGFVVKGVAHAPFFRLSLAPMATGGAVHEEQPLYQPERDQRKTIACSVQTVLVPSRRNYALTTSIQPLRWAMNLS